jgi:serine/threonine-protein kinase
MAVQVEPRPEASQSASSLPRAFGTYLLIERIGRGGMAEIFLARATTELGGSRAVVVKEMLPEHSKDPGFMRALIAEAKLAAQLTHTNIVRVLDLGRESGRLYLAMEYVEGFDLNVLLGKLSRRRIPLPAEFALFIVREVLSGLDYAHRAVDAHGSPLGVVHRDVSPSNVLISLEGEVRLCDFGIARAFAPDPLEAAASGGEGVLAGKNAYMAPEHARGAEVDARSDVFAAGILLWELCAGHRMYKGGDPDSLDLAKLAAIPPLPSRGLPSPERLDAILTRALAFDPAVRHQSARELRVELESYARDTHLMASQLRFAAFLSEHFGAELSALHNERERAADEAALFWSPPPVPPPPPSAASERRDRPPSAAKAAFASAAAAFDLSDDLDIGALARPKQPRALVAALSVALCLALIVWLALR